MMQSEGTMLHIFILMHSSVKGIANSDLKIKQLLYVIIEGQSYPSESVVRSVSAKRISSPPSIFSHTFVLAILNVCWSTNKNLTTQAAVAYLSSEGNFLAPPIHWAGTYLVQPRRTARPYPYGKFQKD